MFSKFFTKLFLLIGMISFLSTSALAQERGEIVEIGQATTTTTLSPIYTPKNYSYTQQLYTAEEIGASGSITSIAFHWAFDGAKTFGIDVYMQHTERAYFETSGDRIPMSDSDKVYTGNINPDHDEWIKIDLDTPFEYDGSSNLVIAVHRTSGSPGFNDMDPNWNVIGTWYYTSTDRYMMLYMGDDQSQYVSLSPAYMTPSKYRPNIQIELASAVATCKAPKNLAASNVSTNSATLTWTAGSDNQTDWDVYLTQSSTDVPNENTTPTYQVTECTKALTGLTAQTTYYAYVRSVCGSDDKSRWVSTNFTTTRNAYHVSASNPYSQDFEKENGWAFANGSLTNQWCWGNATNNGGQKAMYISNDNGTSNAYTVNSAAVVYASKLFTFDQGSYTFVFDWKAMGESGNTPYDYLRVVLVPGDVEFTASTSTPSVPSGGFYNNLPTGWIALDGGHQLNQSSSWQTQTAEIAVSGTYTMVFVWRDDTSTGTQPPAAIDNISISMLSCSKPTNLTANPNNIGSRTATLTWTAGGSESLWDIYLSTSSTAPNAQTTPTESNIGSTSHTFNSLQPATTYYAWVRSNCGGGDVSSWSDVYSFTTSCDAYPIPQLFGFEEEAIMGCFTMRSCASNTGRHNSDYRTGSYCFRFYYNSNPPQYLISPELTGTENGVHVEFYYKEYSSGTEKFKVGYSTTNDATASFTWGDEITNATTSYQLFSADYPAGTKFIGIQYTANNQWYLYIDDLSITGPSACPAPTSFVATNVAATTATLSWVENGSASSWVLQYGTDANFASYTEKTSGFNTSGNNISFGLTGLTPETKYYARVKSVSGSDESQWASCDFTTTATCAAPTGLSASKTGSTITLSWTAGTAGQDAWDIRYKKSTDSEYTIIHLENQASTTYTITGLSPVTTYKVNVRAWCDENDQSKWGYSTNQNNDLSVTTDCGDITIPYFCDFESNLQTSTSYPMPQCWERIQYVYQYSTYYPYVYTASSLYPYAHGVDGNNSTTGKCLRFYKASATSTETAILPAVEEGYQMSDLQIRFWARLGSTTYSEEKTLTIGIMDGTTSSSTFTPISTVMIGGTTTEANQNYAEYTVPFTGYTGNGRYIAIRTGTSSSLIQFFVDDIWVEFNPDRVFTKDIDAYTANSKDHYYLVASPIGTVSPEDVTDMLENNYDLYRFDQAATDGLEWRNYEVSGNHFNLEAGKGYLYANSEDVKLKFIGNAYNGNGQVTLTKAIGVSFEGWNLVGNPFAEDAYIGDRAYYRMNNDGTEIVAATAGTAIAAMEGIFVIATQDQEALTFSTTAPSTRSSEVVVNVTNNNKVVDRAIVRFGEGGLLPKFQLNPNSTKLYIPQESDDYAVVRGMTNGEMPINFKASRNGSYTLSAHAAELDMRYLHLIDNLTGADVNLLENPSYTFEAKTTDYASRFKVVFACGDANDDNEDFAFFSNGNLVVMSEAPATLQVIDMMGRIIVSRDDVHTVSTSDLVPGIYMLRLINGTKVRTQKIVIR